MRRHSTAQQIDWLSYLQAIEQSVVMGHHDEAHKLLKKYSPLFGPREIAAQLASLAIRVHMPLYALKKLHKYVKPKNSFAAEPTDFEKTTYACALYHLGAIRDAQDILLKMDGIKNPEVYFHLARSYMHAWNYPAAVPLLNAYLEQGKLDEYQRLCTRVNLAAAYLSIQKIDKAEIEINDILAICESRGHELLAGNCYELLGQVYFFRKQHDTSLEMLRRAESKLKNQTGWYLLWVQKWILLNEMALAKHSKDLKERMTQLKHEAAKLEQWNTVRDLDYFSAVFDGDLYLKSKVTFGSNRHFISSRNHFYDLKGVSKLKQFLWIPNRMSEEVNSLPNAGELVFEIEKYKCNSNIVKTFYALITDLYEPAKLGDIFSSVYQKEVFNPLTSPARVLKLLKRLDSWFQQNSIPLRVYFKKSSFQIHATSHCQIVVRSGRQSNLIQFEFQHLKNLLGDKSLTTRAICGGLQCSESTGLRLIKRAMEIGVIGKLGAGKNTRYFLLKKKNFKSTA